MARAHGSDKDKQLMLMYGARGPLSRPVLTWYRLALSILLVKNRHVTINLVRLDEKTKKITVNIKTQVGWKQNGK